MKKFFYNLFKTMIYFYKFRKINDKLPVNKQVLAFSATYDKPLLKVLDHFVRNPHHIMLTDDTPCLEGKKKLF